MGKKHESVQQLFSEGAALLQAGNLVNALVCLQSAHRLDPSDSNVLLYIGATLHDLMRFDEAVKHYEEALLINSLNGETHNNLGNSLMALGRFADASDCFLRSTELLASSPVPLTARATALQALGKNAEAEADCRRALAIAPCFAAAHWNLALNLLLKGSYADGWREYEWRWQKSDFTSPCRHGDIPLWDGSPLHGQTILLHAEQGFGDAIQFVRYIPLVVSSGGNVVLECHPQLLSLFRNIKEVATVIPFNEPIPACSYQVPFLTLPRIFGTTLNDIPACFHISVSAEQHVKWHQRMFQYASPKVGIVWAGSSIHRNDIYRSLPLELIPALVNRSDITFFSLQMGEAGRQFQKSDLAERVIDMTDQIYDFADTSALIEELDLVISVDTAVAHLAGTLGKPVYLMLPTAPDWRWLLDRSDSPWYPTMEIFRQQRSGDWKGVIESVCRALEDLINKKKSPDATSEDSI